MMTRQHTLRAATLFLSLGLFVACSKDPAPQVRADASTADVAPDLSDAPGDASHDVPGDDADADLGMADVGPQLEAAALANALGFGGHALLPWPAEQYMHHDGETLVLAPDARLLPAGFSTTLIAASGASRVSPIVTWLPGGIDPRGLPDPNDWGASLDPQSSVRVVVLREGFAPEAWPVLAEIDQTAKSLADATLLLRPHRPFPSRAQVVVGLRTSLRTFGCYAQDHPELVVPDGLECADHAPSQALARILSGAPDGVAEEAWMGRGRAALVAAQPLLGPDAPGLAQAWSFSVRDGREVVDPMLKMQRLAAAADSSAYSLEPLIYEDDRALLYGELDVPWFLDDNDRLVLDHSGEPQIQKVRAVRFLVTIPHTVGKPRPVVLFGHGFFSAIEEPTWGNLFNGLARWQMAAITTRFYGFAEVDFGKAAAAVGGPTLEGLAGIIDLQRQSQANFTVVHNMVRDHLAGALTIDFGDGAFAPLDGQKIPYMGISNGGTQGLVMMSTSPVLSRGALVVPGGGWAHMIQRASQWKTLGAVFAKRFDTSAELQLGMAMIQQIFDPVDSLNFVEHLVSNRLEGMLADPEILIVEAVNDAQVANMVTHWVAGTAGVPLIVPSVSEVWATASIDASLDAAPQTVGHEIYDLGVADNPPGNLAATENGVHDQVRLLDTYREQMGIFLEQGRVVRTCEGPCSSQ
ncbi:MAG: hypothetical protein H0U74_02715 [Bradymonadaceae bacterium]|nr:hypothetical protein [Lujinxingiaceae bacterium]